MIWKQIAFVVVLMVVGVGALVAYIVHDATCMPNDKSCNVNPKRK